MALTEAQVTEIEDDLAQIIGGCWKDTQRIPPEIGGFVFRTMSEGYARRYGVDIREEEIAKIARRLGFWPSTPADIEDVCAEINFPAETPAEFAKDPFKYLDGHRQLDPDEDWGESKVGRIGGYGWDTRL